MDAEVELTQILSEQIALEIDREVLNDLLTQANGANFFWSKAPGRFLDKYTGRPQTLSAALAIGPSFARHEIPDVVEKLVTTYLKLRDSEAERFVDVVQRTGIAPFKESVYAHAD